MLFKINLKGDALVLKGRPGAKLLKIMKLTALILFAACLQVSARGHAQQITLSEKNASIKTIFKAIERQSGYSFLYTGDVLQQAHRVSIKVKDASLETVLAACFSSQPLSYSIVNKNIVVKPVRVFAPRLPAVSPPARLRGTVLDSASGLPLSGVSITIKGHTTGVATDDSGRFELEVPDPSAILMVSYLGYDGREIPLNGLHTIRISLNISFSGLNQAVVIGYGTVKRADLTGAISEVKGSDIESAPVASVDQALQGKAAGMQVTSVNGSPGATTTIRIRGGNSISASNEPLYVIDGYIGLGTLTSINPTDIQSIEVLKDASATAIYGARGANGVILITTKRGKTGKTSINVNSYYGMQQLPKEIALLNGPQLADFVNERSVLYGAAPIYPDVSKVTTTDWQKAVTRKAPLQNSNVSFSGGTDKVTYFFSGNYFNQDGIILNSGFERYQTRLNLDLKLAKWLTIGTQMNFNRSNTNNNKVNLYDILKSAPTSMPVKDSNGNYNYISALSGQTFENPIATAKLDLNNTYDNALLGNWYAQLSFHGLQLRSTLGVNSDNTRNAQYQPGSLPLRSTQNVGGYASLTSTQAINLLNENTASYDKVLGEHHLNVLGGFTYQHETDNSFGATGQGFTNDLLTFNNLATGDPLQAKNSSSYSEWTIVSLLGRLNYSFRDKYLFTASARQDGSSRLSAKNKHAFFPSAAFAWKMADEDFIKRLGLFSNLKLRASYGKTGNQAVGVYSTLATLSVTNAWFNGTQQTGYTLGNIPNDNLKWETTDQYNLGLDAGFFGGRLSVTADAYYKKTYNLLLTAQIPGTTGYTTRLENVGTVANKGVELTLTGVIVDKKDLTWDLSFNIAANRNKVVSLGGLQYRDIADGVRLIVGQPAIVFFGGIYQGTYKTQAEIDKTTTPPAGLLPGFPKFKDLNGNGKWDGLADYGIIGNPQPKFFGGFSSSVRYKRLSLSVYFEYTYGNDVINSLAPRFFMGEYASNVGAQAVNRWTPTNNQSDLPRVGSYNVYSVNTQAYSFAVQDGSFLRLKTLQLSYDLKPKNIQWLQGASVFFTGSNLFIIDHYTWGYDPEVNSSGTDPILRGMDSYAYPQNRSFLFGVNLKF